MSNRILIIGKRSLDDSSRRVLEANGYSVAEYLGMRAGLNAFTPVDQSIPSYYVGDMDGDGDLDKVPVLDPNLDDDPLDDLNEFPYTPTTTGDEGTNGEYIQDQVTAADLAKKNVYVVKPTDFNPLELLNITSRFYRKHLDSKFGILYVDDGDIDSVRRKAATDHLNFMQRIGIPVYWDVEKLIE